MNTEIEEALISELKLGDSIQNDIMKIEESIKNIDSTRELLEELKDERIKCYFRTLKSQLDNYFSEPKSGEVSVATVLNLEENFIEIRYDHNKSKFAIAIQYDNETLFYGISTFDGTQTNQKTGEYKLLKDLLQKFAGENDEWWYCYKDTSFELAYDNLIKLADEVNRLIR